MLLRTSSGARLGLLALLAGGACARRPTERAYPAGTIAGYYAAAFEDQSSFRACDRRTYSIGQVGEFWARYRRLYADTPERRRPPRVFAVLAASVGPEEPAGAFPGGTARTLAVTRVYHMARARGDDCDRWRHPVR